MGKTPSSTLLKSIPAAPLLHSARASSTIHVSGGEGGTSSRSITTHGCGGTLYARQDINVLSPRGGNQSGLAQDPSTLASLPSPRGLGEGERGPHVSSIRHHGTTTQQAQGSLLVKTSPRGPKELDPGLKQIADDARVKGMRALLFDEFAAKDTFQVDTLPTNTRHGSTKYGDTKGMVQAESGPAAAFPNNHGRYVTTSGMPATIAVEDAEKRSKLIEGKVARTQDSWSWAAHHQAENEKKRAQILHGKRVGSRWE